MLPRLLPEQLLHSCILPETPLHMASNVCLLLACCCGHKTITTPTDASASAAVSQIAAGEPLLLSYGKLSNDFLLMDYGFVAPNNPHDRVALRFDVELIKVG